MVDYIDLISFIKVYGVKGIKARVYGYFTKELERPSNIDYSVKIAPTCKFYEVRVFAVNLRGQDSFLRDNNIDNKDFVYMCNGSLVTLVDTSKVPSLPEWYCFDGTLRLGTKSLDVPYITALTYYKPNQGADWEILPCSLSNIEVTDFDESSAVYKYLSFNRDNGCFTQPDYVKSLPMFYSERQDRKITSSFNDFITTATQPLEQPLNVTIPDRIKEDRQSIKEVNDNYSEYKEILDEASDLRLKFIQELSSVYAPDETLELEYLSYMLNGIKANMRKKPSTYSFTGRVLLLEYLSNFGQSSDKYLGTTVKQYLCDCFTEIAEFIKDKKTVLSTVSGVAWDVCKSAFGFRDTFYAGIISKLLGISFDEMNSAVLFCYKNKLSFIRILNENPYVLQFTGLFKFDVVERIALCFGKHCDDSIRKYRDIAMLLDYISDTDKERGGNSTVISKSELSSRSNLGIRLTDTRYEAIKTRGTYLPLGYYDNIRNYIRPVLTEAELGYSLSRFISVKRGQYVERISSNYLAQAIENATKAGVLVEFNDYITTTSLLHKELFVFNKFKELGSKVYNYSHDDIDKYIDEYESIIGFKLEQKQRDAVHLIVNGSFLVAGSAGSGKTTVSNCIVYVLSKLDPTLEVSFAAPTGKAAKRMQEVVKKEVKTLHSKFFVGMSSDTFFDDIKDASGGSSANTAHFFDEGAMITIDLLYSVLKRIDVDSNRIFLFGDFNQLPPIGKGLPFKNLLRFMPCVFLTVSKRAASNSGITRNSNYINEFSESGNWKPLEQTDDFLLLDCADGKVQDIVKDLCSYYLGKSVDVSYICKQLGITALPNVSDLSPDDIQVVTPLAKSGYKWGANELNKVLQPIFNPIRTQEQKFIYKTLPKTEGLTFCIGDRVIHTDKNMYDMQWYSTYKNGVFQKIFGAGICNGEIGKVVSFIHSYDCEFLPEIEQKPAEFEYPMMLRDDEDFDYDGLFVVVEYYDHVSSRNFYILYRAHEMMNEGSGGTLCLKGNDLSRLNLFYAGTTHKLQGSQAKVIICPLCQINFSGFCTREMLYTTVTRGSVLVILLGSVSNSMISMVSRARRDLATSNTVTVGEFLV